MLGCQLRLEVPGSAQPFPEPQDPPRTFDPCPPCPGRPDSDCWDHLLDSTSPKIHFSSAQNHDFWASGGGFSFSPESTLPEHILLQGLSSSPSRLDLPGQKPHLQTHLSSPPFLLSPQPRCLGRRQASLWSQVRRAQQVACGCSAQRGSSQPEHTPHSHRCGCVQTPPLSQTLN